LVIEVAAVLVKLTGRSTFPVPVPTGSGDRVTVIPLPLRSVDFRV
jgi:hypothetical protein